MSLATSYLHGLGYECEDVSAVRGQSCDLLVRKDGSELRVEVKGTTSDAGDCFVMTSREVELHRQHKGTTCLIVVSQIRLSQEGDRSVADGGLLEAYVPWDIDTWTACPMNYRMSRTSPSPS